jgi:putative sterol carrier protein
MLRLFASPEWVSALQQVINANTAYRESAKNWEGDFWFVVEPDVGFGAGAEVRQATQLIYLDLWHGQCRVARVANSEAEHAPEFRIAGQYKNWRKIVSQNLDPIRALMTGQLKLQGNLAKVMRNVRAAQLLVQCAASVPTQFE